MFLRRKQHEQIILDITAIDKRVIARKKQMLDSVFVQQLVQMRSSTRDKTQPILSLELFKHLQFVLDDPKYSTIWGDDTTKKHILEDASTITLPAVLVDELNWMLHFDYLYYHSLTVALLVAALSLQIFPDQGQRQRAIFSALTHDVGITRIPKSILNKPGTLNPQEFQLIRQHPTYSYLLLAYYFQDVDNVFARTAHVHHENALGTGYPRGIEQTDTIAQMIQICDIYDALRSARPFRPAMSNEEALQVLQGDVGKGKLNSEIYTLLLALVQAETPDMHVSS
ncbi:MAG: HD domain-containing protein [Deferribacteres bacterium]|nr:HD domain-containing protein [candidate division KSB1 bacterium]MCB9503299.1 HD domain-containing protein [Deferribacteres bacterium]